MKSWKTTVVGVAGAIAILATQVVYFFDADPATNFSMEAVFAALAALGIGWFARDKNVTSEQEGIK